MNSLTTELNNLLNKLKNKRLNNIVAVFTKAEQELHKVIADEDQTFQNLNKQIQELELQQHTSTVRAATAHKWLKLIPKLT